ncbi:MAG: hypothetical protein JAZ15_21960 [Candidatus Thiodiazotropha endolucinida]|nr:hypothetical protein [Candidatus Thiodiazotropha taylori]MCW4315683.1 hypothetical protein [Candidatus Thiodiazotropha taylori]
MSAVSQLFTPISYLRIKHPVKKQFDVKYPFIASSLITFFLAVSPFKIQIFMNDGLIDAISGLIQILTGFFIASLAAVATFQKDSMDDPISGDKAILETTIKGVNQPLELTRRRFLCYLFGYLALLAIVMYFVSVLANLTADNIKQIVPFVYHNYIKWPFIFIYLFAISNLMTTTLLGLHYMTDRIHR